MLEGGTEFHSSLMTSTWEDSEIRTFLNGDFYDKAFTHTPEKNAIINKTIITTGSNFVPSVTTNDKVFLLSEDEITNASYGFSTDPDELDSNRVAERTAYASTKYSDSNLTDYWLRSPGNWHVQNTIAIIYYSGKVYESGFLPYYTLNLRPAMYIDLTSPIMQVPESNITWTLQSGLEWLDDSTWQDYTMYREGIPLTLPTKGNFKGNVASISWAVKDSSGNVLYESVHKLPTDVTGDIELVANFEYNITFDMNGGYLTVATPSIYNYLFGAALPASSSVVPLPNSGHKMFDHWELDGTTVTSIPAGLTGAKVVKAVYKTNPEVGKYIFYGTYPQSSTNSDVVEPIRWKVLSNDGTEALIFSDKLLEGGIPYNAAPVYDSSVNWENSSLRNWFNNDFYDKAFTNTYEKNAIITKTLITPGDSHTGVAEVTTDDKVFALTKDDMLNTSYGFSDDRGLGDPNRRAERTTYATQKYSGSNGNDYWLRTPGTSLSGRFMTVYYDGIIADGGFIVTHPYTARPAMYIDLSKAIMNAPESKITWTLPNGIDWLTNSTWEDYTTYKEGIPLTLPTKGNFKGDVSTLSWIIKDSSGNVLYDNVSELPTDVTGDIELVANFEYKITFEMNGGYLTVATPSKYYSAYGVELPKSSEVIPIPNNIYKIFDHWEINNVATTSIPADSIGHKVVKAIYKLYPEVNSTIFYGTYPQSSTNSNAVEPIKWRVMYNDGYEALLLSDKILEGGKAFNDVFDENITWETSTIRNWLNNDFHNKVFPSQEEKDGIVLKSLVTNGNSIIPTVNTNDKLFLLSEEEITNELYGFVDNASRVAEKTTYAAEKANYSSNTQYWLRTPNSESYGVRAMKYIDYDGRLDNLGQSVQLFSCIRPAMYVKLASPIINATESNITWTLPDGIEWIQGSIWQDYTTYREGIPLVLPTKENFTGNISTLSWVVKDSSGNILYDNVYELPTDVTGDIELVANFEYNVTFDMGSGYLNIATPSKYFSAYGLTLPASSSVVPIPNNAYNKFNHWEINGAIASSIPMGSTGDIVVKAIYGQYPAVGSTIFYGTYPQSSTNSNVVEPVKWKVLSNDGYEAFVMADKLIDSGIPYNEIGSNTVTWETSTLRDWLNNDFYNKIFPSPDEKYAILSKTITTTGAGTGGALTPTVTTTDKIFLPSIEEMTNPAYGFATDYMEQDYARRATRTKYAMSKTGNYEDIPTYWLRSPGSANDEHRVMNVLDYGWINRWGEKIYLKMNIRPVMYIKLDTPIISANRSNIKWSFAEGMELLDGSTWEDYTTYREGIPLALPTRENFKGDLPVLTWVIKDNNGNVLYDDVNELPTDVTGDIELVANLKYNVTFEMGKGYLNIATPSYYYSAYGLTLPNNSEVVPIPDNSHNKFVRWEIDNIATTSIPAGSVGDKVVKAVYNKYPPVGGTMLFGYYPQSSTRSDALDPVRWKVLTNDGYEAFLVSDKLLDFGIPYNEGYNNITWESCTIRNWLNNSFYNKVFPSAEEKSSIIRKTITTPGRGYTPTITTNDRVFLLSMAEITNPLYGFTDNNSRKVDVTTYAEEKNPGFQYYWLRTPGDFGNTAQDVNASNGSINPNGMDVDGGGHGIYYGIRPAIYVNFETPLFEAIESNITWSFHSGINFIKDSTWEDVTTYKEGFEMPLPVAANFTKNVATVSWTVKDKSGNVLYENINKLPSDVRGDIELIPRFRYKVTFEMGKGHLAIATPAYYDVTEGLVLPYYNEVVPPRFKHFYHFEIGGVATTSIPAGSHGDKVLKAVYNSVPTKSGTFYFGTYPQSSESYDAVEPIKWKVLMNDTNEALIMSDKIIDAGMKYNSTDTPIIWRDSTMRSWLNNDFYNKAFSVSEEQDSIMSTEISSGYQGITTDDKVFLLSKNDVENIDYGFKYDSNRIAVRTKYADSRASASEPNAYWIRQVGKWNSNNIVDYDGSIPEEGYPVTTTFIGIRPAFHIDLKEQIFNSEESGIAWFLGDSEFLDDSTWKDINSYKEGIPLTLPTTGNFKSGVASISWIVLDGDGTTILYENVRELPTDVKGDIILVAQFGYEVSFDMDGGYLTTATPSVYFSNAGLTLPASSSVVHPHHREFDHWEIDGIATTSIAVGTTGAKVVKAIYKDLEYTLKFHTDGRATTPSELVKTYGVNTSLPNLTGLKDGYALDKWIVFKNAGDTSSYWELDQVLDYDILYYYDEATSARVDTIDGAVLNVYPIYDMTITYNDGLFDEDKIATASFCKHIDSMNSITLYDPLTIESLLPDNLGYTFDGYYKDASFNVKAGDAGDDYDDVEITLYAKWNQNEYTIKYNLRGMGATTPSDIHRKYDDGAVVVSNPTNVQAGYTFLNWYKDIDCIEIYDNRDLTKASGSVVYIYAKWKAEISFDANGHGTAPADVEIIGPDNVTLSTISETGWTFGGWYDGSDWETSNFIGNGGESIFFDKPMDLYAKWTAVDYTINYDPKGGTVIGDASFTKTYDTAIIVDLATASLTGYTFDGWYVDDETFNTPYDKTNDDIYVDGTLTYTIYAKWTANTYTIEYDAKGGTITGATSFTKTYGTPYTGSLATPTRRGYIFGGWHKDDETFTYLYNKSNDDIYVEGTSTYKIYAKWTAIDYIVSYNAKGGTITGDASFTKTYGTAITYNLASPSRAGYTFVGWYRDDNTFNVPYNKSNDDIYVEGTLAYTIYA